MEKIQIKSSGGRIHFIEPDRVMWFEAYGRGTRVFLTDGKMVVSNQLLKKYSKLLHKNGFYRIHHKCLVNTEYVSVCVFGKNINALMISKNKKCQWNNTELEVSFRKSKEFKIFICLKTSKTLIGESATLISKSDTLIYKNGTLVEILPINLENGLIPREH